MTAERIELHIDLTGLVSAQFIGAEADKIKELFGSDRIPTPFTFADVKEPELHAAYVIMQIRRLNPRAEVVWCAERCAEFVAFWECEDLRKAMVPNGVN
jgi:hypothetical protein